MKANNLPSLVIPDDPSSIEIISRLSKDESTSQGGMEAKMESETGVKDEATSSATVVEKPKETGTSQEKKKIIE